VITIWISSVWLCKRFTIRTIINTNLSGLAVVNTFHYFFKVFVTVLPLYSVAVILKQIAVLQRSAQGQVIHHLAKHLIARREPLRPAMMEGKGIRIHRMIHGALLIINGTPKQDKNINIIRHVVNAFGTSLVVFSATGAHAAKLAWRNAARVLMDALRAAVHVALVAPMVLS